MLSFRTRETLVLLIIYYELKQYFGGIKNEVFFKNELFFKDPEGVNSRRARPSASCSHWLCSKERA